MTPSVEIAVMRHILWAVMRGRISERALPRRRAAR